MQRMANTDIEIKPGLRVGIESNGPTLRLTVFAYGKEIGPIPLSKAEAIQAGGDICKTGNSNRIPIKFLPADAQLFGKRLAEIANEQS